MKLLVLLVIYSSVVYAESDRQRWKYFKLKYGKIYDSPTEDGERFTHFQINFKIVNQHNSKFQRGEVSWKMGITEFADSPTDKLLFIRNRNTVQRKSDIVVDVNETIMETDIPESFDWRTLNALLPPRKMETDEQSWAFAVAATLEVGLFIYNSTVEYISVQQMLDCTESYDVFGGLYYCLQDGIPSEASYPYTGKTQVCNWAPGRIYISYDYHVVINETSMQAVVAQKGLLIVSIDGSNIPLYDSGIIDGSQCEEKQENFKNPWNVAIVGYGTENGTDYWILRNSLGTTWGEEGYFRLKRDVNACGITSKVWSLVVLGHSL